MIVGFAFAALASASSAAAAITWDELPYPKADAALTAISANKAVVDGKTYHTKCVRRCLLCACSSTAASAPYHGGPIRTMILPSCILPT